MDRIIILGINWEQNSSACLMINGKIISAISEERFTRKKNDESYPKNAIEYVLKINNISLNQITQVCFISNYWSPTYSLIRHYTNFTVKDYVKEQEDYWYQRINKKKNVSLLKVFKNKLDLNQFPGQKFWINIIKDLKNKNNHTSNKNLKLIGQKIRSEVLRLHLGIKRDKISFVDHSFGHIAYAYCSGSINGKNSYVLSIDAFGDFINYSAYIFKRLKNKKIVFKKLVSDGNSIIARMYRYITLLLGMKPNEHEYKVMGLAPYCKFKHSDELLDHFKSFQTVKRYKFENIKKPKDAYFYFKDLFKNYRFDAIAAALQRYTEYLLITWVNNVVNKKNVKNICIAGGVAMNVKANLEISKIKKISQLYIPPSPDDSSQSMGACFAYCLKNNIKTLPLDNAYLGYEIEDKKVQIAIKKLSKKSYRISGSNIINKTVKLLLENKIIGICNGKSEFGARALGNRSIICNPQNLENVKKINETVKNRDFWMPFAASVLDKYAFKYFKIKRLNLQHYKYMTNCLETRKEFRNKLVCAIHQYDNTCRAQILYKKDNSFYYQLIEAFGKKSGIYSLLNTSFNTHGNPIINDEVQALNILKNTNLDAVIIGKYLVEKKN